MRHWLLFFVVGWVGVQAVIAQHRVVFNKTEHDFGILAPSEVAFEQDFIFRNTNDQALHVLSVRSVSKSLSFVFTRSEILKGEYGFIKVRLRTDSISGLFHDEVYVTLRQGTEILSEVIYIRASIDSGGEKDNKRKFKDSDIATSVEVSPSDIAGMEGFLKEDRLVQAEAEIAYLKKQVLLKSDLIARLSDDLRQKEQLEKENLQNLTNLESVVRANNGASTEEALKRISELSQRSADAQRSVTELQNAVAQQEAEFERMRHAADSARAYAQNLSTKLEAQFKIQAEVSERADRLERDLAGKLTYEAKQKARIDSLQLMLNEGRKEESASRLEFEKLSAELAWRTKEQEVQKAYEAQQKQKIEALNKEREDLLQRTDSLGLFLSNSHTENQSLQKRLESSSKRIQSFQHEIDSLNGALGNASEHSHRSVAQLDSLKKALLDMERADAELKAVLNTRDADMRQLQEQKQRTEKDVKALEMATARQLEEAHTLMHRVSQLSQREAEARSESQSLKQALEQRTKSEAEARAQVAQLAASIAEKDLSMRAISENLRYRESEMAELKRKQLELSEKHREAEQRLTSGSHKIDSLSALAAAAEVKGQKLEDEIASLQLQMIESQRKEMVYRSNASQLEARLQNAHMSNELTFAEMKSEVLTITEERDRYRALSDRLLQENERLKTELSFVAGDPKPVVAARVHTPVALVYRVNVLSSDKPTSKVEHLKSLGVVHEYTEAGKYRYAIGEVSSLNEALKLKDQLKAKGYDQAYVVVFREGRKISLKEAIELADSGQ